MKHSPEIKDLAAAMVAAQAEIGGAAKDATNPHYKTRYADLSSVMDACKGALNRNGIAVLQSPAPSEQGTLAIDTVLMHKSGQWASGRTVIPLQKVDPQGYGSAMTYARRYSLAAMVGVCPEDDDGESAMDRAPARQQQPAAKKKVNGNGHAPPGKPTAEQVADVKDLLTLVRVPEGTVEKWFAKAGVDRWEDMRADDVTNCINYLSVRLPAAKTAV